MTIKEVLYGWAGGNVWLFHAINSQHPSWLDQAMIWMSQIGDYRNLPAVLAVWAIVAWRVRRGGGAARARRMFFHLRRFMVAAAVAAIVGWGLKFGLDLPRPVAELGTGARVLVASEQHYSLPSGHAIFIMLVAVTLWPLCTPPYRLVLAILVVAVGISRVWLGAHFPADVVSGYGIAIIAAWLAARLVPYPRTALAVTARP